MRSINFLILFSFSCAAGAAGAKKDSSQAGTKQCQPSSLRIELRRTQKVALGENGVPECSKAELGVKDRRDPFYWEQSKKPKVIIVPKPAEQPPCLWQVCGISLSETRPCALVTGNNESKVVFLQEEIGQGWLVEKITETSLHLKHGSGERKELNL